MSHFNSLSTNVSTWRFLGPEGILVQAAITRYDRLGGLNNVFPTGLEAGKTKIWVPAHLLPGLQMTVFSLYLWLGSGGREIRHVCTWEL